MDWQIEKQLERVRVVIKELTCASPARHDPTTTAKILKSLRLKEGNLERELVGLPPESSEEKAKRMQAAKPLPPAANDPALPEKAKAWGDEARSVVNGA